MGIAQAPLGTEMPIISIGVRCLTTMCNILQPHVTMVTQKSCNLIGGTLYGMLEQLSVFTSHQILSCMCKGLVTQD